MTCNVGKVYEYKVHIYGKKRLTLWRTSVIAVVIVIVVVVVVVVSAATVVARTATAAAVADRAAAAYGRPRHFGNARYTRITLFKHQIERN